MEYDMKGKPVIAILGEKGGVGKSTISNMVAQILHFMLDYKEVQYINLDVYQDYRKDIIPKCIKFDTIPEEFKHLYINEIMIEQEIDACVIDSGGYYDERLEENMQYIDTLIFPTTTDPGSYLMLKKMFKDYGKYVGTKQIIIVINQYDDSSKLHNFGRVKSKIVEDVLHPLGISLEDVEFKAIKKSQIPVRINSNDENERLTIEDVLKSSNPGIYRSFIGSIYDISMSIEKNIKNINKGK